jgi:ADP-ribose pyrophosphatase YjhB (NUDIX family)
MNDKKINVRLRIVIIKDGKLLVQYRQKQDFYHYVGGHLEWGETILEGCKREIFEECNEAKFEFKKILYVCDFTQTEKNEHNVEFFILGELDKYDGLERWMDPEHPDNDVWCTWLDINNLPDNLWPHPLSKKLVEDYKNNFPNQGEYIGRMDR